jgi:hypothetical protein
MTPFTLNDASSVERELEAFVAGDTDPASFTHAEHVRLAFEILQREEFETAIGRFAQGLRRIATRAGAPRKYHTTVTVAFLSLIAERRLRGASSNWSEFAEANADLFDRRVLHRWYPAPELADDVARRTFVLPAAPAK